MPRKGLGGSNPLGGTNSASLPMALKRGLASVPETGAFHHKHTEEAVQLGRNGTTEGVSGAPRVGGVRMCKQGVAQLGRAQLSGS